MRTAEISRVCPASRSGTRVQRLWNYLRRNMILYLFILPALLYILVLSYGPMYGIQIAFKDFRASDGIWGSEWVGFKHFITFFQSFNFWTLIRNTISISLYSLIAGFPVPIILALAINHCASGRLAKVTQSLTYAPHFISTVVLVGMISVFLAPSSGFVNKIIEMLGGEAVFFMGTPKYFIHIYVWSGIWQNMGWSSVIYIASLTSVPPELHEAAIVDGATKLQRIWSIDLPWILPTAVILLIMNCGQVMNVGFEKVFLMQNEVNLGVSEIISTYVYKTGLQGAKYSYSAAIGLFNNVINFGILVTVNKISKIVTDTSLW